MPYFEVPDKLSLMVSFVLSSSTTTTSNKYLDNFLNINPLLEGFFICQNGVIDETYSVIEHFK